MAIKKLSIKVSIPYNEYADEGEGESEAFDEFESITDFLIFVEECMLGNKQQQGVPRTWIKAMTLEQGITNLTLLHPNVIIQIFCTEIREPEDFYTGIYAYEEGKPREKVTLTPNEIKDNPILWAFWQNIELVEMAIYSRSNEKSAYRKEYRK